ncbi:MAG: ABC transporter permease [Thermoanaerobaculia bacterium]|nr:MAG: ABC transporter permease [Thermoanaerobaculia bacterium]MBZ0103731.1 ABC transporter permease [Thermoanaerobaculia bacterium]
MSLFDLDHWQEIGHALAKNRLRTFLTAFGVFWGIFLLVVLLGSGNGLTNGVMAGFEGTATNSFFCWGMRTSKPFAGLPAGRSIDFTDEDTAEIRRQVPDAAVVAPRLQRGGWRGGVVVRRGGETGSFSVMGDHPEIFEIQSVRVEKGRLLGRLDVEEARKVAVIGTRVQEVLFPDGENPIGDAIEINGVWFKVIGVFGSRNSGGQADRDAQTIYIPFTTFQNSFNAAGEVHWYAVTAAPGVSAERVEEQVLTLLRTRHKVAADDRRGIGSFNLAEEFAKIQGLFAGIRLLMWIVGLGTLTAGAIGVSNIMLIVVRERTREIGIRRAIGARPGSVIGQIVLEAVVLTAAAGLLGLAAGVATMEGISGLLAGAGTAGGQPTMFKDPGVMLDDALIAVLILVTAGTVAGLIPAQRAVAVNPVVALRSE